MISIKNKRQPNAVKFSDVRVGDTLTYFDKGPYLKTSVAKENGCEVNAVNLTDGVLVYFSYNDPVVIVNYILTEDT